MPVSCLEPVWVSWLWLCHGNGCNCETGRSHWLQKRHSALRNAFIGCCATSVLITRTSPAGCPGIGADWPPSILRSSRRLPWSTRLTGASSSPFPRSCSSSPGTGDPRLRQYAMQCEAFPTSNMSSCRTTTCSVGRMLRANGHASLPMRCWSSFRALHRRALPGPFRCRKARAKWPVFPTRIRGVGPPLVLLPLFLTPSQWEPLVPALSERYCTLTLGGTALGAVAILEGRGHAIGYLQMVRTLIKEAELRPGEAVLEIGCGSGVLARWLARRTAGRNRITGVDINPYLLREAKALARQEGLEGAIEFRDGNAEALPFADNSFEFVMSMTVIEETDADRMLAEMVRVAKPGGRVAVIARALDLASPMNLPLSDSLKAKVEAPGFFGDVSPQGCADASLYRRVRQAGLTQVKILPQLTAFDGADPTVLQFLEIGRLRKLNDEEVREWQAARAEAEGAARST